jgi:hypothetical protein
MSYIQSSRNKDLKIDPNVAKKRYIIPYQIDNRLAKLEVIKAIL